MFGIILFVATVKAKACSFLAVAIVMIAADLVLAATSILRLRRGRLA